MRHCKCRFQLPLLRSSWVTPPLPYWPPELNPPKLWHAFNEIETVENSDILILNIADHSANINAFRLCLRGTIGPSFEVLGAGGRTSLDVHTISPALSAATATYRSLLYKNQAEHVSNPLLDFHAGPQMAKRFSLTVLPGGHRRVGGRRRPLRCSVGRAVGAGSCRSTSRSAQESARAVLCSRCCEESVHRAPRDQIRQPSRSVIMFRTSHCSPALRGKRGGSSTYSDAGYLGSVSRSSVQRFCSEVVLRGVDEFVVPMVQPREVPRGASPADFPRTQRRTRV